MPENQAILAKTNAQIMIIAREKLYKPARRLLQLAYICMNRYLCDLQ